jgi:N utilization substance protein B
MRSRPDRRLARRTARLKAVQALYQIGMTGQTPEIAIAEFIKHRLDETIDGTALPAADAKFFGDLVRGVSVETEDLDAMISAVIKEGWSVERLEATLLAVLRAGTWELANREDIPVRATISEYTDVAGAFEGERETALVNGVLNRIAAELRPDEMARPGLGAASAGDADDEAG